MIEEQAPMQPWPPAKAWWYPDGEWISPQEKERERELAEKAAKAEAEDK